MVYLTRCQHAGHVRHVVVHTHVHARHGCWGHAHAVHVGHGVVRAHGGGAHTVHVGGRHKALLLLLVVVKGIHC